MKIQNNTNGSGSFPSSRLYPQSASWRPTPTRRENSPNRLCSGFTLLETIIYIALFGILMTGAVTAAWGLLEGAEKNKTALAIQEEGMFLQRKINWALTGASAVEVSGGNTLTITRPDLAEFSESPIVITASGTAITLARGNAPPLPLNNDRFVTSNLLFTVTEASGERPASVTANFLVQDKPFVFKTYLRQ